MARFNDSSIGYGPLADRPSSPSGVSTRAAWVGSSTFSAWEGSTWTQYGFAGLSLPVSISNGGTGQTSSSPAFDALAPTTTKGDLIVYGTTNVRQPVGTTSQVLIADSSAATGLLWRSFLAFVGGDTTTSSTTPVDIPGLSVSVLANRNYAFEVILITDSSVPTEANYFSVNGPASPTNVAFTTVQSTSNTAIRIDAFTAYDTANSLSTGFAATNTPTIIRGVLENGANAGSLVGRYWTETGAAEFARVRRGSWMRVWPIPL